MKHNNNDILYIILSSFRFDDIEQGSSFDIVNLPFNKRPQRWYLCYLNCFENLERASVSLLMLSAKQGNHWYQVLAFGLTRPLLRIEPCKRALYHKAIEAVQNMFFCQIYKKVFI